MNLEDTSTGTVKLGDLEVRRLGFGAMRISGARNASGARDRDEAKKLVKTAVDRGVNLIDTADIYGYGESEEIIAEALFPYPEDLVITSKAGFKPGKVMAGHATLPPLGNPEHIKQACEGSLRRLRVDTIDVFQAHVPDPNIPYAETLGAIVELQEEGKVRHIGVSNVSTMQLDLAREMCEVVLVENRYNAGLRDSDDLIAACEKYDLAFLPYSPIIIDHSKAAAALGSIAEAHGAIPQQVALQWLLHRSPKILPIPGTSQLAHLNANIDSAWVELSSDELKVLDEVM